MSVITVTNDTFEAEVLRAEVPVLVDFWAPWCSPCKAVAPLIDEIAAEVSDIKVCKVDVDENQALAKQYHIVSIPYIALFKGGELVRHVNGAVPKAKLLELLS